MSEWTGNGLDPWRPNGDGDVLSDGVAYGSAVDDAGYYDEHDDDLYEDDQYDDAGDGNQSSRISRRGFLTVAGAGAGTAALAVGAPPVAASWGRRRRQSRGRPRGGAAPTPPAPQPVVDDAPTRFGRMFNRMPPFAFPGEEINEALIEASRPGGMLDANDDLTAGPVELIVDPALSENNPNNTTHTAGTTFVGQFIDHDLTRDGGSTLGQPQSLRQSANLRTPRLDLDSIYGGGPLDSPQLYTADPDAIRFIVESGGMFEDLPRDANNRAIVAEPRNDENMMISGLQVAMLLFHNAVAERVEAGGLTGMAAFEETQRLVRWHWQWIVIHEFLPQICGQAMLDEMATRGPRHFNPASPQIPVEFQGAAYRFGHSMVRPSYRANMAGNPDGSAFFAMIFDVDKLEGPDPDTLLGGYRAPRRFIGWQTFFDFGDGEVKPNKKIDTKISTPLFRLPTFTIDGPRGADVGPTSLATRNLLRHITWMLPSGQSVAAAMRAPRMSRADLDEIGQFGARLDVSTPLWYYVLREAELVADGEHLGPVGGRIVAETFTVLLARDETSYPGAEPNWRPTLPSAAGDGDFRMTDLLTIAGVDPQARGQ